MRFTQYDSSFHFLINIFAYLKRNNLLQKTDQRERGFKDKLSDDGPP